MKLYMLGIYKCHNWFYFIYLYTNFVGLLLLDIYSLVFLFFRSIRGSLYIAHHVYVLALAHVNDSCSFPNMVS
jgi:hypothetical protein